MSSRSHCLCCSLLPFALLPEALSCKLCDHRLFLCTHCALFEFAKNSRKASFLSYTFDISRLARSSYESSCDVVLLVQVRVMLSLRHFVPLQTTRLLGLQSCSAVSELALVPRGISSSQVRTCYLVSQQLKLRQQSCRQKAWAALSLPRPAMLLDSLPTKRRLGPSLPFVLWGSILLFAATCKLRI